FVSPDNRRTFAVISLRGNEKEKIEALERLERLLRVDGIETQFGGEIPVFEALTETTERDLQRAELIAFPITAVLLVVIFGSVVAAGVPLILGAFAIVFALAVVRLIATVTDLSVLALNVITVLGLGLAIDYSLFILNRYREEVPHRGIEGAIVTAVGTTGRAAAFSGVTLAASLVGLFVFPQVFLRSMAIGGIAVTLIAVLIATTLLPALLAVLGPRIDALRLPWVKRSDEESEPSGFWHRLSMWVMRRAPFVAAAVVILLLVLGLPFLRFQPAKQDFRALGPGVEARQVSEILDSEFLPHETTPNLIALTANQDVLTPQAIGELYDYVQWVKTVPGVTRVDSMFSVVPNLSRQEYQDLFSSPAAQQGALGDGLSLFAEGPYSRLSVVSAFDVDSPEAQQQVRDLRAVPAPSGMTVLVGGNAADLLDTKDSIRSRVPLTLAVIGVVTFIVLFLVYGSITLPIKAMIMNLLSLTASAGIVVWIFQDGRFENILRYDSLGTLDVTMPILLFGIVFGLSMDYEVLMLSRIREEYVRTGDNTLAVALGLEKTGRLITSAAALL
ncbi:MAG: MMPL family transporter, partial [Dehalococcoidia bacterium]